MEIVSQHSCELSSEGIIRYMSKEINRRISQWRDRMQSRPRDFAIIERETMALGRELAGLLTGAVLASDDVEDSVVIHAERIRRAAAMKQGYRKPRRLVLLSGLVLWVTVWYCCPRRSKKKPGVARGAGRRGKEPVGLYPEWAALGIREGVSPELQSEIGRQTVLGSSMEAARRELVRHGVDVDIKTVRRVSLELGLQALAARREALFCWREGRLEAGEDFQGKRVVVSIDGGRARTRIPKRKGKRQKRIAIDFRRPGVSPRLSRYTY